MENTTGSVCAVEASRFVRIDGGLGHAYICGMFKLPEITYPLTIDTIGKMMAMGEEMTVSCHSFGCGHMARINLVMLARRLGMDHSCMAADLKEHFYCKRCYDAGREWQNISFRCHTLTVPFSPRPRQLSAYEKAKGG